MKKLTLSIFMAASLLACTENQEREANSELNNAQVETEQLSNEIENEADAMEADVNPQVQEARQRTNTWTRPERREVTPELQPVEATLVQFENDWQGADRELTRIESGEYKLDNMAWSDDAMDKIKKSREKVAEAQEKMAKAREKFAAGKYDDAVEKIEDANEKMAEAQEKYLEAIEKQTGVDMD